MELVVKSTPASAGTREMWAGSLGREDPPEEGPAAHSSVLAWRIPQREGPWGCQELGMTEAT